MEMVGPRAVEAALLVRVMLDSVVGKLRAVLRLSVWNRPRVHEVVGRGQKEVLVVDAAVIERHVPALVEPVPLPVVRVSHRTRGGG